MYQFILAQTDTGKALISKVTGDKAQKSSEK
jgi:hypothetical protein